MIEVVDADGAREIGSHQVGTVGVRIFLLKVPAALRGGDRFTIVTIDKFNYYNTTLAKPKLPTPGDIATAVVNHVHFSQQLSRRN